MHSLPPYRWVRVRATLYPNALIRVDLINCNEVRSVPSPLHQDAIDDIGSIAPRAQPAEEDVGEGEYLADFLCPFQFIYSDGLGRFGAENA